MTIEKMITAEAREYWRITPEKVREYRRFCKEIGIPRKDSESFLKQLKAVKKAKEFGARGGLARRKNMTAKERSASASKAAKARWAKKKKR